MNERARYEKSQVAKSLVTVTSNRLSHTFLTKMSSEQVYVPNHTILSHTRYSRVHNLTTKAALTQLELETMSTAHYNPSQETDVKMNRPENVKEKNSKKAKLSMKRKVWLYDEYAEYHDQFFLLCSKSITPYGTVTWDRWLLQIMKLSLPVRLLIRLTPHLVGGDRKPESLKTQRLLKCLYTRAGSQLRRNGWCRKCLSTLLCWLLKIKCRS